MFPLNALLLLSEPSVLTFRALFELPEFGVRSHQFHGLYQFAPFLNLSISERIQAFI